MVLAEQQILISLGEILNEVAGIPADRVTADETLVGDLHIDPLPMVEIAGAAQGQVRGGGPDHHLRDQRRFRR